MPLPARIRLGSRDGGCLVGEQRELTHWGRGGRGPAAGEAGAAGEGLDLVATAGADALVGGAAAQGVEQTGADLGPEAVDQGLELVHGERPPRATASGSGRPHLTYDRTRFLFVFSAAHSGPCRRPRACGTLGAT